MLYEYSVARMHALSITSETVIVWPCFVFVLSGTHLLRQIELPAARMAASY